MAENPATGKPAALGSREAFMQALPFRLEGIGEADAIRTQLCKSPHGMRWHNAVLLMHCVLSSVRKNAVKDVPNTVAKCESPFHVAGHACRPDCGACCIAPSISSPIPGMPNGKPAGVRCVQLGDDLRCAIFGQPERPACCSGLQPQTEMCGANRDEALAWLTRLETQTQPQAQASARR
jgi:uncharacterized protein